MEKSNDYNDIKEGQWFLRKFQLAKCKMNGYDSRTGSSYESQPEMLTSKFCNLLGMF